MAKKVYDVDKELERIIGLINNCDQKANILLAFVSVMITLLFTSALPRKISDIIIIPFVEYWQNNIGAFHCGRFILFLSILSLCVFTICTLLNLIKVIKPQLENKEAISHIFYAHIAHMKYEDFKNTSLDYDYKEDMYQQIYINAKICTNKFVNLRRATNCLIGMLVSCFLMYIILMFL